IFAANDFVHGRELWIANSANAAPSFAKGGDQNATDEDGPRTLAGWATGISAGPPDEASQTVNFNVDNNNHALFSVQPVIDPSGTLTFTPAPNMRGTALVSVTIHDTGGTANGGID